MAIAGYIRWAGIVFGAVVLAGCAINASIGPSDPAVETGDDSVEGRMAELRLSFPDTATLPFDIVDIKVSAAYRPSQPGSFGTVRRIYYPCGSFIRWTCDRDENVIRRFEVVSTRVTRLAPNEVAIPVPERLTGAGAYLLNSLLIDWRCKAPACEGRQEYHKPQVYRFGASMAGTAAEEYRADVVPEVSSLARFRGSFVGMAHGGDARSAHEMPAAKKSGPDELSYSPNRHGWPAYRDAEGRIHLDPPNFLPPFAQCLYGRIPSKERITRSHALPDTLRERFDAHPKVEVLAISDVATSELETVRIRAVAACSIGGAVPRRFERSYHFCRGEFLGAEQTSETLEKRAENKVWRYEGGAPHEYYHRGYSPDPRGGSKVYDEFWNRVGAAAWPEQFAFRPDFAEFEQRSSEAAILAEALKGKP